MIYDVVVIGAGAGGCFAAIRTSELYPGARICILESARKPLSKVEISGGGRCNVTHACFEPQELVEFYPRGSKELLGPFYHFQPSDMVAWFKDKGVTLKTETDGRMFPITDRSSTIMDCFLTTIRHRGIRLSLSTRAKHWAWSQELNTWSVHLQDSEVLQSKLLLIATGSDQRTWDTLRALGHQVVPPVPSLFTFNIRDEQLTALQGISKSVVKVSLPKFKLDAEGPLLITHWGMSGPAILKLSAWGARVLYDANYVFDVEINWTGDEEEREVAHWVRALANANGKKQIINISVDPFSSRLWKYLCHRAGLVVQLTGAEMSQKHADALVRVLCKDTYRVTGKSTFKDEFVTAGGVALKQVDMRTFESRLIPGLFFAGEVLDIDAVTGGFNFQAAWTGAALAAEAIAGRLREG